MSRHFRSPWHPQVNKSFESSLQEGLEYEKMLFYFLFTSEDQKEGMAAFLGKRAAEFKGR